jgi:hypothetical protein
MQTQGNTAKDVRAIRYVSLAAGTIGAMFGEFMLATQTGMSPWFAWTYPLALDAYAYVAFRTGRKAHVTTALVLMAVSQAMTHLVSAHIIPMSWPVVVGVWAAILPAVICLTHFVAEHVTHEPAAQVDEPAAWVGPGQGSEPQDEPADKPAAPVAPVAPVVPIAQGRRNWKLSDAVNFVRENWEKDNAELAALMSRTERQIRNYRSAATVAA